MTAPVLRGDVPGLVSPPMVSSRYASLAALARWLDMSQWLDAGALAAGQQRQLASIVMHFARTSPHFAQRLEANGLSAHAIGTIEGLKRLPVLTRTMIQDARGGLFAGELPEAHGPAGEYASSGSTGEPIIARKSMVAQLMWQALTIRHHRWHWRDPVPPRMATLRPDVSTNRVDAWGGGIGAIMPTGELLSEPITTDVARQAALVEKFKPDIIYTLPNNLAALAERARGWSWVRQIRTTGETLSAEVRELAEEAFGAPVVDCYSTSEMGYIAIECPDGPGYHVMSEAMIVEILRDDDSPCAPGEAGRVVLTDLVNFATPLIRYAIGDWAEAGAPCPCGRGLPVINRIVGRERNIMLMPDGTRNWPIFSFKAFSKLVPIRQFQFIQHDRKRLEMRYVTPEPLPAELLAQLETIVLDSLGQPFALEFTHSADRLDQGSKVKFEGFVNRVPREDWP